MGLFLSTSQSKWFTDLWIVMLQHIQSSPYARQRGIKFRQPLSILLYAGPPSSRESGFIAFFNKGIPMKSGMFIVVVYLFVLLHQIVAIGWLSRTVPVIMQPMDWSWRWQTFKYGNYWLVTPPTNKHRVLFILSQVETIPKRYDYSFSRSVGNTCRAASKR